MAATDRAVSDTFLIVSASLLISLFIWYIAKQEDVEQQNMRVAVRIEGLPPTIEAEVQPSAVVVAFHYPKTLKRQLAPSNFEYVLNHEKIVQQAGINEARMLTFVTSIQNVKVPPKMERILRPVSVTDPGQLIVSAKWRLREALVEPVLVGSPAANYAVTGAIKLVDGPTVLLTGSEEALSNAADPQTRRVSIKTRPIDISGLNRDVQGLIALELPPGLSLFDRQRGAPVRPENAQVAFELAIDEKVETRRFPAVPIELLMLSKKVSYKIINVKTAEVAVTAPVSLLKKIDPALIQFRTKLPLDESRPFSGEVAIEPVWSQAAPAELRENAKFSELLPSSVMLELTPLESAE